MKRLIAALALGLAWVTTPSLADELADRIACSTTVRASSTEACTRLIEARETPRKERFMAHFNRAWSYRRAGDNQRALADLDAAAAIDDTYPNLFMTRAMVREALGNDRAALADLDRYVALAPGDWTGFYRRAIVHRQRNASKEALADIARAGDLNPYEKALPPLRILVLSDMGRQDAARSEADKLLAARRSDALGNYARAVVMLRMGRRADAGANLDAAIQASPLFAAAHALKGEIAELAGDRDGARASYDAALRIGGPDLDAETAREKARRRMAALGGGKAAPALALQSQRQPQAMAQSQPQVPAAARGTGEPAPVKHSGKGECRRFIPSVATTVAVKCE
ncbi:MAG: tetratricopeptide repeat protein [Pseudomonadota bacterium]